MKIKNYILTGLLSLTLSNPLTAQKAEDIERRIPRLKLNTGIGMISKNPNNYYNGASPYLNFGAGFSSNFMEFNFNSNYTPKISNIKNHVDLSFKVGGNFLALGSKFSFLSGVGVYTFSEQRGDKKYSNSNSLFYMGMEYKLNEKYSMRLVHNYTFENFSRLGDQFYTLKLMRKFPLRDPHKIECFPEPEPKKKKLKCPSNQKN